MKHLSLKAVKLSQQKFVNSYNSQNNMALYLKHDELYVKIEGLDLKMDCPLEQHYSNYQLDGWLGYTREKTGSNIGGHVSHITGYKSSNLQSPINPTLPSFGQASSRIS